MKTQFAMVIHFHQPVGNFDHVIERACKKCYIPFFDVLKKYPDIKMTFHLTGCLLEWIMGNIPEMIDTMKQLVEKGQVEIMTGGFHEPIIPSIPYRDRVGQIKMFSDYIKNTFSYQPQGAWVAERVWEPEMVSVYHDAKVKYIVLDDTHFVYAGIKKEDMYGYYITENETDTLAVFPSDKFLRYSIPFKYPDETINYIKNLSENENKKVFIYGDDGEKFGEWPGTFKWIYEEKWLENFFTELNNSASWLETVTLSKCLQDNKPLGRVYLPTASYDEMLEWSLPADTQEYYKNVLNDIEYIGKKDFYKPFIRGGFWKNFLVKYPESNQMNKKMFLVSQKLVDAEKTKGKSKKLDEARQFLYRGQCNCAYWHGVFGGLYLFHLRQAIYNNLIKSEALIDEVLHGEKDFLVLNILDYDCDGRDEIILENKNLSLYIDPSYGGVIKEIDSKKICCNLTNTLARRKEAYHKDILEKIEKEKLQSTDVPPTIHDNSKHIDKGVDKALKYDKLCRDFCVDHFIEKTVSLERFKGCEYSELIEPAKGKYDFEAKEKKNAAVVLLKREGTLGNSSLGISKKVTLDKKSENFHVEYMFKNTGDKKIDCIFAPEFNLTMPYGSSDRYVLELNGASMGKTLEAMVDKKRVKQIGILDLEAEISVNLDLPEESCVWVFPLKTVSQSEKAYELNYQGTVFVPRFDLKLREGEEKTLKFSFNLIDGKITKSKI